MVSQTPQPSNQPSIQQINDASPQNLNYWIDLGRGIFDMINRDGSGKIIFEPVPCQHVRFPSLIFFEYSTFEERRTAINRADYHIANNLGSCGCYQD